jgi:hypothetical protein
MKPQTGDRRQHRRYTVENSIMVTDDGVFQLTDVSKGGFCFKCPPHADILAQWVTDILTPVGDLKEYCAEKRWVANYADDDPHFPMLMKVGVKFGQLSKDQHSHLEELINSVSEYPPDWKIDQGKVI